MVTVAELTTAGFTPSVACNVTETVASSLHVSVGVSVAAPVSVQTVPGISREHRVGPRGDERVCVRVRRGAVERHAGTLDAVVRAAGADVG